MAWVLSRFRAGDLVEVRGKEEILATLDQNACADGLPFMPEMFQYCGKRFHVSAVAHKTCDMVRQPGTGRRLQSTVHLDGLRCDGLAHDGCQAECNLFWKDEWLKPVDEREGRRARYASVRKAGAGGCTEALVIAKTRQPSGVDGDGPRYSCQATQMYEATQSLAWWDVRQYLFDIVTGNHSGRRVLRVLFLASLRRLLEHAPIGYRVVKRFSEWMHLWLSGRPIPSLNPQVQEGAQTPTGRLFFQAGDYVQIKMKSEIEQTLNQRSRNRGLMFDFEEMAPYCGRIVRVRKSVTKIIEESTGKMLTMKEPCIMLDGVVCNSEYARQRLNCPRAIPSYWREIWLRRASEPAPSEVKNQLLRD
ncbi:MAG: hypothetical protein OJF51_004006 [Nitrospira sp.]|jgi:hypothetical protein|nr:MAG: hypothetical protein OJF51_004006 [Nitrospira sp.]